MNIEELRISYEKETGKKWWTNPVCHGDTGFASWEYQKWLEDKIINSSSSSEARTLSANELQEEICLSCINGSGNMACIYCDDNNSEYEKKQID